MLFLYYVIRDLYLEKSKILLKDTSLLTSSITKGNLKKYFGYYNGKKYYVKTSFSGVGKVNYECEAECVSCRLANLLGLDYVVLYSIDYAIYGNDRFKVCYSKDFVGCNDYKSY